MRRDKKAKMDNVWTYERRLEICEVLARAIIEKSINVSPEIFEFADTIVRVATQSPELLCANESAIEQDLENAFRVLKLQKEICEIV